MDQRPPILPIKMTPHERAYVLQLFRNVSGVVENSKRVNEIHPFFGTGQFFYPKNPGEESELTLSFNFKNFQLKNSSVSFNRQSRTAPWNKASLMVTPRDFPTSAYEDNLPEEILTGFEFVKSSAQESPYGQVTKFNLYEYRKNLGGRELLLNVKSHAELSNLVDSRPKNFYYITMEIR